MVNNKNIVFPTRPDDCTDQIGKVQWKCTDIFDQIVEKGKNVETITPQRDPVRAVCSFIVIRL